jgi:hypothetical protein
MPGPAHDRQPVPVESREPPSAPCSLEDYSQWLRRAQHYLNAKGILDAEASAWVHKAYAYAKELHLERDLPPDQLWTMDGARREVDQLLAGVQLKLSQPEPRLKFDPLTLVITLDGKEHPVKEPKAFSIYKALADVVPEVLTKEDIGGMVKGVSGDKTIPRLIAKLPEALRKTVKPTTAGYSLLLPRRKVRK